jgi:hypothetical protein
MAAYRANPQREIQRVLRWQQENRQRYNAKQRGVCAICGREPRPGKHLHIDHDHDTGRVRGLLCFSCNVGVGNFHHDVGRIARAREYLDDDAERPTELGLVRDRVRSLVRAGSD